MKYLFDAFAWIAYLEGGSAGEKVNKILQEDNEIYTLSITVAEVVSKTKRMKRDAEAAYLAIISNSTIIDAPPKISKEAGLLHAQIREKIKNFGIVDTLIAVTAKSISAKILTGDEHFKNFKEAIFINK